MACCDTWQERERWAKLEVLRLLHHYGDELVLTKLVDCIKESVEPPRMGVVADLVAGLEGLLDAYRKTLEGTEHET